MSAIIRYQPRETGLTDALNDFLEGNLFNRWDRDLAETMYPKVDILEEKDFFRIKADMPGLDKKDIKVEVENGVLTISGEKREEKTEKDKNRYYHYERTFGSFCRSFRMPENASGEHVDATYANGVLELTLKKSETSKPKAIEVKVE
jgi:HSP20 family protein